MGGGEVINDAGGLGAAFFFRKKVVGVGFFSAIGLIARGVFFFGGFE